MKKYNIELTDDEIDSVLDSLELMQEKVRKIYNSRDDRLYYTRLKNKIKELR